MYTDEYLSKRVREVTRENRDGEGRACVWSRLLRSISYYRFSDLLLQHFKKCSSVLSSLNGLLFFFFLKASISYFIINNVSIWCQRNEGCFTDWILASPWNFHFITILYHISSNAFLYSYSNIAPLELFQSSLTCDFTKDFESKIDIKFKIGNF